ncbi:MAG: TetR/AcrR family transcriptional regulator C-terminal domain-containing protein [Clostridia bacterium]|nr:TetR/AcrR family transcriptional regulator C-terminal domain-containing protein [Clostridia bacterium]
MAESHITKNALAAALKTLMRQKPFEKISISDICSQCGMSRKSFYYHFRDKYDLVNWIFDSEFIAVNLPPSDQDDWSLLAQLCQYLYENRCFYRKAMTIDGQNAFRSHFRQRLAWFIGQALETMLDKDRVTDYHVDFLNDGLVGAIERWLLSKDPIESTVFLEHIETVLIDTAVLLQTKSGVQ